MSALPADDTAWPPEGHGGRYDRMRRLSAWYAGTPGGLASSYGTGAQVISGGPATSVNPSGIKRVTNWLGGRGFWGTAPSDGQADTRRHLPLFNDICTLSSEWLFSEPITIRVDGPTDAEGQPMPETVAAQAELDAMLEACNFQATLLAAAETGSALGASGLRIAYDKAKMGRPVIIRQDADTMVPLYSWGQLTGVMFWQVVLSDSSGTVWRHLEVHDNGTIWHALYKGDGNSIGKRKPLNALAATAPLMELVNEEGAIVLLPEGGRTATSVPNMLPDPEDRVNYAGRSDFTPPVLDVLDALDKTYSEFLETLDDAKSRIFVASSMVRAGKPGEGASVDLTKRVYTTLNVPPSEKPGAGLPIEKVQFEMRVEEYLKAMAALSVLAIKAAGYNPDTETNDGGADMTATEYNGKRARSMSTRGKKIGYWRTELSAILTTYLAVAVKEFAPIRNGMRVQAFPVRVEFPEAVQPTQIELANVAKALKESGAASLRTIVGILHPEWTPTQVTQEVEEILGQASVIDPVSFGTAGAGVGPGDGV